MKICVQCGNCGEMLTSLAEPCKCGQQFVIESNENKGTGVIVDLSNARKYTIEVKPDIDLKEQSNQQ